MHVGCESAKEHTDENLEVERCGLDNAHLAFIDLGIGKEFVLHGGCEDDVGTGVVAEALENLVDFKIELRAHKPDRLKGLRVLGCDEPGFLTLATALKAVTSGGGKIEWRNEVVILSEAGAVNGLSGGEDASDGVGSARIGVVERCVDHLVGVWRDEDTWVNIEVGVGTGVVGHRELCRGAGMGPD